MANVFSRSVGGSGGGAFGTVPGPIPVPPTLYSQAAGVVPNLAELSKGAGAFAGTELAGQLSPETIRNIQDQGAAWGVGAGMPGFTPGSLVQNKSLRNLGLTTEAVQHQGIQDFLSTLTGIGGTMTPQPLAAEISNRNALMASAPDPRAAAEEQMRQWMEKFNLTRGGGGRSLNWAQMFGGGSNVTPGFGTGRSSFLGGFDPGLGGAPEVGPFGATGPFDTSPAGGTLSPAAYTLTGNTLGGSPHDDVLDAFFNPEDYVTPPEQQDRTSGAEFGG